MKTSRPIKDLEREQGFSLPAGMIFAWDEKREVDTSQDPITRNWIYLPPEMMEEPVVQEYFEEVDS